MEAGKLDRRITLQRFTTTKNEFNEDVQTWADLATVWASKEDIRDSERWQASEVAAEVTTRFRIRWSNTVKDIDPRDRVLFDGRIYAINAVKEIGRRVGLEITAAARAERVA